MLYYNNPQQGEKAEKGSGLVHKRRVMLAIFAKDWICDGNKLGISIDWRQLPMKCITLQFSNTSEGNYTCNSRQACQELLCSKNTNDWWDFTIQRYRLGLITMFYNSMQLNYSWNAPWHIFFGCNLPPTQPNNCSKDMGLKRLSTQRQWLQTQPQYALPDCSH